MLENFYALLGGLQTALQWHNLLFAFLGCTIGTLIGVVPGIGPVAGTAILLPIAATMEPATAIIMLAAIYYGAMYGGTITSVLMNVPGEAASAITCIDGHEMAKQGRGGAALTVAALGSFVGGSFATIGLVFVAGGLAALGLRIGPPEFFAIILVGLALIVGMAGASLRLTLISAIIGLFIGMVGLDPVLGVPRFTFGRVELLGGVSLATLAMGIFGVSEVLANIERAVVGARLERVGSLRVTRTDLKTSAMPVARGTLVGFVLGIVPGMSAVVSTVVSYTMEKLLSRTPERFGKGAIEGVAGPETANNAHANAALIPLFSLGIPGSPTVAILMGGFLMQGLTPGPFIFQTDPDIAWAIIASLFVGNIILLGLNIPLVPIWVRLMSVPQTILMPLILLFCVIGVYSVEGSVFDVWLLLIFGLAGYLMRKVNIPVAPILICAVLGPLMEQALRQSLEISRGSFDIFLTRPLTLSFIVIAFAIIVLSSLRIAKPLRGADSEI